MSDTQDIFHTELQLSYRFFLPVIAYAGILAAFLADSIPNLEMRMLSQSIGVIFFFTFGVVWIFDRLHRLVGAIVLVALYSSGIYVTYVLTQSPSILTLVLLAPALAAVLINLRASLMTSFLVSLPLLQLIASGVGIGPAIIALGGIWSIFGLMTVVYLRFYRFADWSRMYYKRTIVQIEEIREQRAELKQTLADLERANLNLTRMNRLAHGLRQAAEEARSAKAAFVANVSHELRTPLNMITGFAEILLESPDTYGIQLPQKLLADLNVVYRNAVHLSDLVDDVLDLSQMEVDEIALTKEYVHIDNVIQTSLDAVRPLYETKALFLRAEIENDLPVVFCDQTRIREVLLNLLSNAGRFVENGGTVVRAWQENQWIYVSVRDTGPGIAPENMNRLFQPFQQLDSSIRRRFGGSGLGLSISKRFIELHNGKIWAESELNKGTTFFFQIPIVTSIPTADAEAWRVMIRDWEYVGRSQPSLAPKPIVRPRIVVLDDENVLLRLLSRYWGDVEIVAVSSPEEAIVELSQIPTTAVIMNQTNVVNPGVQLNLSQSMNSHIPVFRCSVPGVSKLSAELGIADRLIKPIARTELLGSLERLKIDKGTVLIVDDEPDALQLFSRMLSFPDHRYRILIARNGVEAVDILKEHRPTVMLLDLVMPNMDGFELLERRKHSPNWQDIPVILISASDPTGQPIISRDLLVTLNTGLSVAQLLAGIQSLSKILRSAGSSAELVSLETAPDSQVSE